MIKRVVSIIKKDFREAFKNRTILIVLLLPLTASLLFTIIDSTQMEKNFNIGVVGQNSSDFSEFVKSKVENFKIVEYSSVRRGERAVRENKIEGLVSIREINGQQEIKVFLDSNQATTYLFLKNSLEEIIEKYLEIKPKSDIEFITINTTAARLSFLPVWISIIITMIGILIISGNLAEEKENKTLDSLLITPARKSDILLGKTIFGIIFTMITVLLMCFINGIFDIGWNNIFNLIIMIFIGAASFTSVGLLIGAVAESQSSARAIGTILYFPLLFPTLIYNLSDFTRKLARFFPTFYLFRGMEKVLIYRVSLTNLMTEMSILVVFATVFFLLTYIKFKKVRG